MRLIGSSALVLVLALAEVDALTLTEAQARLEKRDNEWVIALRFDRSFAASDFGNAQNPANYVVFDVLARKVIPAQAARVVRANIVDLDMGPKSRLSTAGVYHVYALNLTFTGSKPAPQDYLQVPVTLPGPLAGRIPAPPTPKPFPRILQPANTREDSDIYLAGQAYHASGTNAIGSADIKVKFPFYPSESGRHKEAPLFDLKWSNDPKADPDTLTFGWEDSWLLGQTLNASGPLRNLIWRNTPELESDRGFDNTNALLQSKLLLPARPILEKLYLTPVVGAEVGKNFESPLREARGNAVERLLGGTILQLPIPVAGNTLDRVVLTASHERRWPLSPEVYFRATGASQLLVARFGTNPKDHVEVNLNFMFKNNFGGFLGYEYGSLPPKFTLVDHKLIIGIVYTAAIAAR